MHIAKSRDSVAGKKINYAIDLDKGIFNYIPTENDPIDNEEQINNLKNEFEYDEDNVF